MQRMNAVDRREQLLSCALELAEKIGFQNVRRQDVADSAGVTMNLINHYFSTMPQLRRAIMRAAVTRECTRVIAQGLAVGDKQAKKAPEALRRRAAAELAEG